MNRFPEFLQSEKETAESYLINVIKDEFSSIRKNYPHFADLLPEMEGYIMRKGKRIRPILTVISYKALSGNDSQKIYQPAIGTEFLHAAFLINDDIYDDMPGVSATRGGQKVLHDSYSDKFSKYDLGNDSNWDTNLFAKHSALVAINIFYSICIKLVQTSVFSKDVIARAMGILEETFREEWVGQGIDILSKSKPLSKVTADEVIAIERNRSASYSTRFPLVLGATFAGANGQVINDLSDYGYKVGLAFQLQDDIMGMFADPKVTGKIQDEIAEGKRTLLLIKTMELSSTEGKNKFAELLKKGASDKNSAEEVRAIIRNCGALKLVQNMSEKLIAEGKLSLKKANIPNEFKNKLIEFADFAINRDL